MQAREMPQILYIDFRFTPPGVYMGSGQGIHCNRCTSNTRRMRL